MKVWNLNRLVLTGAVLEGEFSMETESEGPQRVMSRVPNKTDTNTPTLANPPMGLFTIPSLSFGLARVLEADVFHAPGGLPQGGYVLYDLFIRSVFGHLIFVRVGDLL